MKEQYEFILSDKEPMWKVTVCGFATPHTNWNRQDDTLSMIDYALKQLKVNGYDDDVEYKYNNMLQSNARVYFYFDNEYDARMCSKTLEHIMVDLKYGLPNTIEPVNSIDEGKTMKYLVSMPQLRRLIKEVITANNPQNDSTHTPDAICNECGPVYVGRSTIKHCNCGAKICLNCYNAKKHTHLNEVIGDTKENRYMDVHREYPKQANTRIHSDTLADQVKNIVSELDGIAAEMDKNVSTSKNHKYIYNNNYKSAYALINSCVKRLNVALKKLKSE